MKKLIITLIACSIMSGVYSQNPGINAVNFNPAVDSVAEALVQLAWNNPQIKSTENLSQQFEYIYKRSKTLWMNNLTFSANLNEYSIQEFNNPNIYNGNTLYPRYNFGVFIPMGLFLNNGKQTKSDYYKFQSTLADIDAQKLLIRRNVLLYYEEYLMNKKLVAFQQEVVQDARVLFTKYEEKFQKGEVTLENYLIASKSKNTEEVRFLNVDRDLKASETQLEALIGMRLNDALEMIAARQGRK